MLSTKKKKGVEEVNIKLDTKKIMVAMVAKGMSGADLAKEVGCTQQAISAVLCGKRLGRFKIIPGICKALELDAKEIVIIED